MKALVLPVIIIMFFISCNTEGNEATTDSATTTEHNDTTSSVVAPVAPELPIADLPKDSKREEGSSQGISVLVAPGMKVEDFETFVLVCSEEVVRDAKCFTIEFTNNSYTMGSELVMLNGRTFYYIINDKIKNNTSLTGYLKLGNSWYLVKATDPDPKWIFPYLAHIELSNSAL